MPRPRRGTAARKSPHHLIDSDGCHIRWWRQNQRKTLFSGFNGFVLFCFVSFSFVLDEQKKLSRHLRFRNTCCRKRSTCFGSVFRFSLNVVSTELSWYRFFEFCSGKMCSEPIILSYNRLLSFTEEFLNVREPYFRFWVSPFISLHLRVTNFYLL